MTRQQYLEHYLEQLDLTNVALARLAGVAPSSVQRWTAGTIEPPLVIIRFLECLTVLKRIEGLSIDAMRMDWLRPAGEEVPLEAISRD